MPVYENDGLSLAFESHGSGAPVVMLHGAAVSFAGNFGACGWVDPFAARGLRVIGLDLRGHGASAKPADPARYGIDALASDVVAVMDHLEIERAAIVGYSIGSAISLHALHTYPARLSAGALVATGDGLIGRSPMTFPTLLPPLVDVLRRPELPQDMPPAIQFYWTFAEQVAGDRAGVAAALSGDYPPCTLEDAAAIDAPVLVVSGEVDQVLGTGAQLADALPRGRYLEVAGADHFTLAVDATVQAAVADFLVENG